MEERKIAIQRVPQAAELLKEWQRLGENKAKTEKAFQALQIAKEQTVEKRERLSKEQEKFEQEKFDEWILQLSLDLEKVRSAKDDFQKEEEAKKNLENSRSEYKRLLSVCPKEDFPQLKAEKEKEIEKLGQDESLLDYLKHNFKEVLLSETYFEVRMDLTAIAEKYPQTGEDIRLLKEKYTLGDSDGVLDIAQANLAFKEIEKKRKDLKKELSDIEERERKYIRNENEKELLSKQGTIYKEVYENAQKRTEEVKKLGTEENLVAKLNKWMAEKTEGQKRIEDLKNSLQELETEIRTQMNLLQDYQKAEVVLQKTFETALEKSGFKSVDEARLLLEKVGGEKEKEICENFFKEYGICLHEREKTDFSKFQAYDENAVSFAEVRKKAAEQEKETLVKELASCEAEKNRLQGLLDRYKEFEKELKIVQAEKELCDELRQLLRSNKFLEYIASEYLQEICSQASKTLLSLTSGRYFLRYEKEFKVGDNLDGGSLRAVKTLSGGETFLASLSLALSLSAAICLKSLRPIEFFFLDEGFGTLDGKLVETVMDVLTKLSKSFSVGLISHVEELKHRIDCKLLVTGATESYGSKVRIETF